MSTDAEHVAVGPPSFPETQQIAAGLHCSITSHAQAPFASQLAGFLHSPSLQQTSPCAQSLLNAHLGPLAKLAGTAHVPLEPLELVEDRPLSVSELPELDELPPDEDALEAPPLVVLVPPEVAVTWSRQ